MPLQNRVTPNGQIVAQTWRGDFMGNRGGRIHDPETKTLLNRRWASRRWIICVTSFKARQRSVMGAGYTELFFLDEVTALASGHRPCFECRRQDAKDFAAAWQVAKGLEKPPTADEMDLDLHEERRSVHSPISLANTASLPDGAMIQSAGDRFALRNGRFIKWTGEGYVGGEGPKNEVCVLTPPAILAALNSGYRPIWHDSALKF
ncbi:MAG: hypothetical protein AAF412_09175 [Pseudomonadota bacterium]